MSKHRIGLGRQALLPLVVGKLDLLDPGRIGGFGDALGGEERRERGEECRLSWS